jgi:hypothetical protein
MRSPSRVRTRWRAGWMRSAPTTSGHEYPSCCRAAGGCTCS